MFQFLLTQIAKIKAAVSSVTTKTETKATYSTSAYNNSDYITSGEVTMVRIGDFVVLQFADIVFNQAITISSSSNEIALFNLPVAVSDSSRVLFTMQKFNADEVPIRVRAIGDKITPFWSYIPKVEDNLGFFGTVVFKVGASA